MGLHALNAMVCMTRGPTCNPPPVPPAPSLPSPVRPRPASISVWFGGGERGRGGWGSTVPHSSPFPHWGPCTCTPRRGVTLLYGLSICSRLVQMDTRRSQVHRPSPAPGSGILWVTGRALAGQTRLLPSLMDGLPYPQLLTLHEPQYMPWGVLRVRPIPPTPGRCYHGLLAGAPRCIPPSCICRDGGDTVTRRPPYPSGQVPCQRLRVHVCGACSVRSAPPLRLWRLLTVPHASRQPSLGLLPFLPRFPAAHYFGCVLRLRVVSAFLGRLTCVLAWSGVVGLGRGHTCVASYVTLYTPLRCPATPTWTHCCAFCFATCASRPRAVPRHRPYLLRTVRASQLMRPYPNPTARTTATSQA